MDHDAMHKDVQGLKKFKAEAEEAIAFYKGMKAAGGAPAPGAAGVMTKEAVDQIVAKVVEQLLPKVQDLTGRVEALEQKPEPAQRDMSSFDERLAKLEAAPAAGSAAVGANPALADRTEAMLTWFEANQEGLEILLGLDGQPDDASAGTAPVAATGGTGAADAGAGTTAAPAADTGSTGSVSGAPGTSQDPSADAAKVVDQPAAGGTG